MYKMDNIAVPGGVMSIEAPTIKDLWKEAAFLQAIPHTCPVDGSPTRFGYKEPGAFKYWVLFSTGERVFEFKFGQDAASGELFPGSYDKKTDETHRRWTWWDWQNKREIVVWEDGQLTAEGRRLMGGAPVPSGARADDGSRASPNDNPANYPESLDEVEEMPGGTVPAPAAQGEHRVGELTSSRKPGQVAQGQLNTIHALGMALYNFDKPTWDAKRPGLSKTFSKGRTESSSELWVAEAAAMQAKLEEKVRGNYEQAAQDLMQTGKVTPFDISDIDELHGVELANAYRALCAKAIAPATEQKKRNAVAAIRN